MDDVIYEEFKGTGNMESISTVKLQKNFPRCKHTAPYQKGRNINETRRTTKNVDFEESPPSMEEIAAIEFLLKNETNKE